MRRTLAGWQKMYLNIRKEWTAFERYNRMFYLLQDSVNFMDQWETEYLEVTFAEQIAAQLQDGKEKQQFLEYADDLRKNGIILSQWETIDAYIASLPDIS